MALAGLSRSLGDLGSEFTGAVGRSPFARHPALTGALALLLGMLGGRTALRGLGPALRLVAATAGHALTLAPLALGLSRRRFF